jgi:hypothetical protein
MAEKSAKAASIIFSKKDAFFFFTLFLFQVKLLSDYIFAAHGLRKYKAFSFPTKIFLNMLKSATLKLF